MITWSKYLAGAITYKDNCRKEWITRYFKLIIGPGDSKLCKKYFEMSREGTAMTVSNIFHYYKIQQDSFLAAVSVHFWE